MYPLPNHCDQYAQNISHIHRFLKYCKAQNKNKDRLHVTQNLKYTKKGFISCNAKSILDYTT